MEIRISENAKIGAKPYVGAFAYIGKNATIGDNVKIQAQSGIGRNIKDDEVLQGSPALGYGDFNKSYVYFKKVVFMYINIARSMYEVI